jgi:hypothetical protein
MPGGDGTGPLGMGPMTGRAAGYCAGYPAPGFMNPYVGWGRGFGRGLGRGRGFWGRGRGRGFYLTGLPGWARWGPSAYPMYGYGAPNAPFSHGAPLAPYGAPNWGYPY